MTMEREWRAFNSFLKTCGDFAGEDIDKCYVLDDWYKIEGNKKPAEPFDNRPDIICITKSDRRIGIELKAWLNEDQIAEAKRQQKFNEEILAALGDLPQNNHRYIKNVWLRATPKRFNESDVDELRNQIFGLIRLVDEKWSEKPKYYQSSRERIDDLSAYPILAKYLDFVEAFPRRVPIEPEEAKNQKFPDKRWIAFPYKASAYGLADMLAPLQELLVQTKADNRYENICGHVGLSECYLLVHYDWDAFAYNTPFDTPDFSFQNVVEFARNALDGDSGFFQHIFLLNCLPESEEAHLLI